MTIANILFELDAEIARLESARMMLVDGHKPSLSAMTKRRTGTGTMSEVRKRKPLSAEARKRIADAQRKRWAAYKKANK